MLFILFSTHFLLLIRCGFLLYHDMSYFLNRCRHTSGIRATSIHGIHPGPTDLEIGVMTDGKEAILHTCVKFNWLLFIM